MCFLKKIYSSSDFSKAMELMNLDLIDLWSLQCAVSIDLST